MILSRAKPAAAIASTSQQSQQKKQLPQLEDFLKTRDYTGALSLLEFSNNSGKGSIETDMWIGFCAFHLGDYKRAMHVYENLMRKKGSSSPPEISIFLACCYFYLGMYPEADKVLENAPANRLKTRLLFHLSHKFSDEKRLMAQHQQLEDVTEDQLSLAAIHYLRSHYQEAIDIYKRILLDNREYLALNVYVALCYYKLDYYDVSQEVLAAYLQQFPDSAIALNLKACNHFRLYNGKAAEAELKPLMDQTGSSFGHDLIKHNLVVFRSGEGALQVLPPLVDVIPEARLNLVIYYLKQDEIQEAYNLIKDLEPAVPQEYILKGVVNAALGQELNSREHLKVAQQFFQLVGGSASECDTIPGRQCMASCFFLLRQFDDVLLYLSSIKSYFYNDDNFNFNYAQAKVAVGSYKEAEETFLMIQSEKLRTDPTYISLLARCHIMNRKAQQAWELYLRMDTSSESFSLLQLIANDCYRTGQFYHAAKAFDVLERLDPNPEYWEGKRGACVGIFQLVVAGIESKDALSEAIQLLRNSSRPQVEHIIRIMKKWAKDNRVSV